MPSFFDLHFSFFNGLLNSILYKLSFYFITISQLIFLWIKEILELWVETFFHETPSFYLFFNLSVWIFFFIIFWTLKLFLKETIVVFFFSFMFLSWINFACFFSLFTLEPPYLFFVIDEISSWFFLPFSQFGWLKISAILCFVLS